MKFSKTCLCSLFSFLCWSGVSAQVPEATGPFPLYPNGASESNGLSRDNVKISDDNNLIIQAADADYYLLPPDPAKATGQAILICPGGGYWVCCFGYEGLVPAKWMQEQGIYAVVLRYRMPNKHHEIPLKDVATAMEMMRSHAKEWKIDPQQIGIMGFSAGGHLAASASTLLPAATRPNWTILGYPVVTFDAKFAHMGSRENLIGKDAPQELVDRYCTEKQVNDQTPPAFIMMTSNDKTVPSVNATLYYDALVQHHVPAELHIYPFGPHGFAWKPDFAYRNEMLTSLSRWLVDQNAAAKKAKE